MNAIGEKSADTAMIESMIRELKQGDVLSYSALDRALGRDFRKFCRSNFQTARKSCERDGIVLSAIINEGYKRLDDSGIVKSSEGDRKRIKRASNRAINRLAHVAYEKLSSDEKKKHTTAAAQLGAVAHFSGAAATKKIESSVNEAKVIPIGQTLKLFVD